MKNSLDFNIPFSYFANANFIGCFSSTYIFIEGIDGKKDDAFNQYFCLFETMSGCSSLRCRFGNEQTSYKWDDCDSDSTIDFLFGFAGYEYRICSDKATFKGEIAASVDAGRPVIAKVKPNANGAFRVITGYDGDALICPEYIHAHDKPESVPSYDEMEMLYIIGGKVAPRYTLKHGLERIQQVREKNITGKLWDEYIEKIGGWLMFPSSDGWQQADTEERKTRMERLNKAMWCAMNCHSFGETFRNCRHEELRNPALSGLWKKVSELCYSTDAIIYGIDYLNKRIDWSGIDQYTTGPGVSAMVCMMIEKVKAFDAEVLETIKQAIEILK